MSLGLKVKCGYGTRTKQGIANKRTILHLGNKKKGALYFPNEALKTKFLKERAKASWQSSINQHTKLLSTGKTIWGEGYHDPELAECQNNYIKGILLKRNDSVI